ncbi:hypothetical protein swp_2483 [Shewanella piezotolerans WP3]|uniref:Uncharacterized protein n=1 Tax=Shewanella piezotolerans (strain WP3 / JCM 13877) TaxID=225849 RepID=B8CMG8_SHEPW|nr:hypothetical protein swp_2483 [Shewanella piezotolerans WP3]
MLSIRFNNTRGGLSIELSFCSNEIVKVSLVTKNLKNAFHAYGSRGFIG